MTRLLRLANCPSSRYRFPDERLRSTACRCSSPAPGSPALPPRAISSAMGADVTVVDARDRVGGRVWTIRDGFADGQHAEAGGDMIDEDQHEIRALAERARPEADRASCAAASATCGPTAPARPRIVSVDGSRAAGSGWPRTSTSWSTATGSPSSGGTRRSPPTSRAARSRSGSTRSRPTTSCGRRRVGLRGFFLADPDELSLLALVDQFASDDAPAPGEDVSHRGRQRSARHRARRAARRSPAS